MTETPPANNAANSVPDPNAPAVVDANGNVVNALPIPFPESHTVRESFYDDREARITMGRMWLVSFTDLFSLMLCFFVLLYSMKDPNIDKINEILGKPGGGGYAGSGDREAGGDLQGVNIQRVAYGEALDLSYLHGVLKKSLEQSGLVLGKDIEIKTARDHLKILVDPDPASEQGIKVAELLGERLSLLSNRVTVVGLPSRWSSGDWAGSIAQASGFARHMKEGGYRKGLTVLGLGEGAGPGVEIRVEGDDGRVQ